MSYSFAVQGATTAEAVERAKAELLKVVDQQPIHKLDQKLASDTVEAVAATAGNPPEGCGVQFNVSGSIIGVYSDGAQSNFQVSNLSLSVNVYFPTKAETE